MFDGKPREWLVRRGLPAGTVQTTLDKLAALSEAAAAFKKAALAAVKAALGRSPSVAFGNTDLAAYQASGAPAERAYDYGLEVPAGAGGRTTTTRAGVPALEVLPAISL